MSTFEKNKNLPQIKALPDIQLKTYKRIMDELDSLRPQIEKIEKQLSPLRMRERDLYEQLERLWNFNRIFKKKVLK